MRRYIFNPALCEKKSEQSFDVVVVGGGMAGLFAALELDEGLSVALVVKGDEKSGSSFLAQGGISCVWSDDDDFDSHIKDTLAAGAGHCDCEAVEFMVKNGPSCIKKLIAYGVPFDKDESGNIRVTREGGHSKRRILHCGGDATGKEITRALGRKVAEKSNITLFRDHTLVDILTDADGVTGVVINDGQHDFVLRTGDAVIATGGAGQLYRYSTTPEGNTGEGIAACLRAGAESCDMEFVQFHPTAFAIHGENERVFLISEAVRGEGAILKNKSGQSFMHRKGMHPLADLAPRDIVTRAVLDEMRAENTSCVYLDTSAMTAEFFEKRFPTITAKCRENGIVPSRDMIPVHPTQHYLMGGIKTDLDAKTCVPGLYVCGEAACTGAHGANRLASNSTLECVVFAESAAKNINKGCRKTGEIYFEELLTDFAPVENQDAINDMLVLKDTMTELVGAVRRKDELEKAKGILSQLLAKYEEKILDTPEKRVVYSAAICALETADAAYERKHSIGAHFIVE